MLPPVLDGYHFFDTCRIWFSQNKLQKVSILIFKFFINNNLYTKSGYQYFYRTCLTNSHDVESHKFLSFGDFHQPVVIIFSKKKTQIYNIYI